MTDEINDPKLTAYALGELDGAELAEVEALLESSPAARAAVDEIRAAADVLTRELAAEPGAALTVGQRETIQAAATGAASSADSAAAATLVVRRLWWKPYAIAASILVLVGVPTVWMLMPSLSRAREMAKSSVWMLSTKGEDGVNTTPFAAPRGVEDSSQDVVIRSREFDGNAEELRRFAERSRLDQLRSLGYIGDDAAGQAQVNTGMPVAGIAAPHPSNRFDFSGNGKLSYGYQVSTDGSRQVYFTELNEAYRGEPYSIAWDVADLLPGDEDAPGNEERFPQYYYRPDGSRAERYDPVIHNPFLHVGRNPLSTFSIDVDTASYANARRFLNEGRLPPAEAVRVEEFINYFKYDYPQPVTGTMPVPQETTGYKPAPQRPGEHPFSVNVDVSECPWMPEHRLMRVGLKGMEIEAEKRPVCNLVFLLDVSGSMADANKLPLVKQSLDVLVNELWDDDRVAMVVYAGASGLVLDSTKGADRDAILDALDRLDAGGSTNGGEGIELAYAVAREHFIDGGVNRVILATDGDFNVGVTNQHDLVTLIEEKARGGVFLSVLGFGMGNYQDASLEKLADKGNGNYAYIDTAREAEKVLGEQVGGTLVTIAKDVKIQVEFNPVEVAAYRLIGYENRLLAARDFNDDTKDAGEIGAGHTVTALYEIAPVGVDTAWLDELRNDVIPTAGENDVIPTTDGRRDLAGAPDDSEQSGKIPRRFASRNDEEQGPATPPDPEALAEEDALPNIVADEWVDPLRYQTPGNLAAAALGIADGEVATVKLRYKQPDSDVSQLLETPVVDYGVALSETSDDFRFAASVASFGMLLRGTPYAPEWTFDDVLALARGGVGADADGYRAECVGLVEKAAELAGGGEE